MLCVPRLLSSIHTLNCLREEIVSVPGRSGAQSSVALTRWQQFKEGVCWVWGVQTDFATPFAHSGLDKYSPGEWGLGRVIPVIRSAVQHSLLRSDLVAEPDSYWSAEDGFNDGRVELLGVSPEVHYHLLTRMLRLHQSCFHPVFSPTIGHWPEIG